MRRACVVLALTLGAQVLLAQLARAQAPPAPLRFGAFRAEIRELEEPASVAVSPAGEIFVVEAFAHRVRVFDSAGKELRTFGAPGSGDGELLAPRGIAIAPDGEVYVSDTGNHRIQVFDTNGLLRRKIGVHGDTAAEFNQPLGLAVDAEHMAVADARNHRIQVFTREGRFEREFGRFGRGDGELNHPVDVAIDARGAFYVADGDNHRLVKFDAAGKFVKSWGDFGPYSGLFLAPSGVRCAGDRIYVADRDNHRIQVFGLDGALLYEWGLHALQPHEGNGRLHYPNQIAIAPDGKWSVIAEAFENRCQLIGPETDESAGLTQNQQRNTSAHFGFGIDARADLALVVEPSAPVAVVYDIKDSDTPIEITRFGSHGASFGAFIRPYDVELDPTAALAYVTDPGNARLSAWRVARKSGEALRFDPELAQLVRTLDLRALFTQEPQLEHTSPIEPQALECDAQGNIALVDAANARVVLFDKEFKLLKSFGGYGRGTSRLREPSDVAFSRAGDVIYVVDALEQRIKAFDRDGNQLYGWGHLGRGPSEFVRPSGIAAGQDGFVYVTDEGAHRIQKFDEMGRFIAQWGKQGLGRVEFYKPRGIAQDGQGRLFVVDYGNHRGQILTPEGEFVLAFGARLFTEPTRVKR